MISKLPLIASVLTIAQFIYGIISALMTLQIPTWLFFTTSITCFLLGLLVGMKRKSLNHNDKFKKIAQLKFDYLPDIPSNHGWKIVLEPENGEIIKGEIPHFSIASDYPNFWFHKHFP